MSRLSEVDLAQFIKNRDRDPIEQVRVHGRAEAHNMPEGSRTAPQTTRGSIGAATHEPCYKSKLEEAFAYRLVLEKRTGLIIDYWYERVHLRLPGQKNFFKPDFLVLSAEGLTFYEVKGHNRSDDRALVKIKTAAGLTPWAKFVLVKRLGGQWDERTIC